MTRKISPIAVAALTGALGLATTPLWAGSDPERGHYRQRMTMEQSPEIADQTQMNSNWSGTAGNQITSHKVEEVQEALKEHGYDPGPVDGVFDAETEAALQSFQYSSGLAATGQLDAETLARLGVRERSFERSSAADQAPPANSGRSYSAGLE
jgi:murein L,D-transpeptidase YcbB/YkuD